MIFISAPYTDKDEDVTEQRVSAIKKVVAYCAERGVVALSPVLYYHEIAKESNLPIDFKTWEDICYKMLEKCDSMWVLKLDGWDNSVGVSAEMKHADVLNIPYILKDM